MAKLAIEGHKIRGSEVIELLGMLGGKNFQRLNGKLSKSYYIIDNKSISVCMSVEENYVVYTLEEFENKFPYKVGDKVMTDDGDKANIVGMVWDNDINDVFYEIQTCDDVFKCPKELLQPYKEETITIDDFKANTKEWLLDKLQSMSKDNAIQTICNLYYELHKPKYPKTYEECCGVLNLTKYPKPLTPNKSTFISQYGDFPHYYEILKLAELLVCRDAYWKIAGEELGLGEPWKPDWENGEQKKYCIYYDTGIIQKGTWSNHNSILAFPTMEMRDAFYENFKDLIEKCKELL